jgi:predicted permease
MRKRAMLIVRLTLPLLLFSFIAAPHANAYIDPGSSSFVIQIIIATAAGAGLAIATFWRRIRAFFSRNKSDPAPKTDLPPTDDAS